MLEPAALQVFVTATEERYEGLGWDIPPVLAAVRVITSGPSGALLEATPIPGFTHKWEEGWPPPVVVRALAHGYYWDRGVMGLTPENLVGWMVTTEGWGLPPPRTETELDAALRTARDGRIAEAPQRIEVRTVLLHTLSGQRYSAQRERGRKTSTKDMSDGALPRALQALVAATNGQDPDLLPPDDLDDELEDFRRKLQKRGAE